MRYASVCSGIEAPSVAWHPLDWKPVFFSEIDKFPCAVLKHHYPDVPNHGDMNGFKDWPDAAFDLLIGGTPCQSFSVAGLRKGLADPRGNLALVYLAIADRYRPRWLVWENVPGVLSSDGGRDFGAFLGGLGQLGYGWAYRVLDAQHCRVDGLERAVPQRRRRVFVVGYLGDWRRAAAVLSFSESMSGHPAPRREAGKGIAPTIAARTQGGGGLGTDFDCDGGLISHTLLGKENSSHDHTLESYVPAIVPQAMSHKWHKGASGPAGDEVANLVAHSLRADGFDASEDGTGRGTPLVAYQANDYEGMTFEECDRARPLTNSPDRSRAAPILAIQERAVCENPDAGPDGAGIRADGSAYTLEASTVPQAVAFAQNSRDELIESEIAQSLKTGGGKPGQSYPAIRQGWAVRRLTPEECEALQGLPRGYTAIPYRGKEAADGPRYKALGNSMAVNCIRWIGRRIDMVEVLAQEARAA